MFTWIATNAAPSFGSIRSLWRGTSVFGRANCGPSKELWRTIGTFCYRRGMGILALSADERVLSVAVTDDQLSVDLADGRTISVPLAWYARLLEATPAQRARWRPCGGGYGIHWPDIDEHLSTEGLLRGAPSPELGRTDPSAAPKGGHAPPRGNSRVPGGHQ